jgi:hydrogenase nickel incorporation protein HypB
MLSVTEGADKPKKYPLMFLETKALVIHKIDLVPYLDIDVDEMEREALDVNPQLKVFRVSSKTGEGMDAWVRFLVERIEDIKHK